MFVFVHLSEDAVCVCACVWVGGCSFVSPNNKTLQTQNSYMCFTISASTKLCVKACSLFKTSAVEQMCIYNIVLFILDAAVFSSAEQ